MTDPTKLIEEIDALAERATGGHWEISDSHGLCVHVGGVGIADIDSRELNKKPKATEQRANAFLLCALVNAWPLLRGMLKDYQEILERAKDAKE